MAGGGCVASAIEMPRQPAPQATGVGALRRHGVQMTGESASNCEL